MKGKPDSITTEQYRELVKMLRAEGWAIINFGELKKDEVWLMHHNGLAQRVKYEQRSEFAGTILEKH